MCDLTVKQQLRDRYDWADIIGPQYRLSVKQWSKIIGHNDPTRKSKTGYQVDNAWIKECYEASVNKGRTTEEFGQILMMAYIYYVKKVGWMYYGLLAEDIHFTTMVMFSNAWKWKMVTRSHWQSIINMIKRNANFRKIDHFSTKSKAKDKINFAKSLMDGSSACFEDWIQTNDIACDPDYLETYAMG